MKNIDTHLHVKGESMFVDDRTVPAGTLYAAVCSSTVPFGKITDFESSIARNMDGVIDILMPGDIPGDNQIGNIIEDEVLLAEKEVHFVGQPVAVVIAESDFIARSAAKQITVKYHGMPPHLDAREAGQRNLLIAPERTFSYGC